MKLTWSSDLEQVSSWISGEDKCSSLLDIDNDAQICSYAEFF